jgi:DNA-binding MarR family transcriptional regulator
MRTYQDRAFDYQSLANFRYEIRRYLNFSEQAARDSGIEPHQHQALLAIKGLPRDSKATIGVLADRLQIRHHSAVELVNRLELNQLIRRSRNRTDRREVLLQLTGRGERLLQSLSMPHRAELQTAGPRLLEALSAVIHHDHHSRVPPNSMPRGRHVAHVVKRHRRSM